MVNTFTAPPTTRCSSRLINTPSPSRRGSPRSIPQLLDAPARPSSPCAPWHSSVLFSTSWNAQAGDLHPEGTSRGITPGPPVSASSYTERVAVRKGRHGCTASSMGGGGNRAAAAGRSRVGQADGRLNACSRVADAADAGRRWRAGPLKARLWAGAVVRLVAAVDLYGGAMAFPCAQLDHLAADRAVRASDCNLHIGGCEVIFRTGWRKGI